MWLFRTLQTALLLALLLAVPSFFFTHRNQNKHLFRRMIEPVPVLCGTDEAPHSSPQQICEFPKISDGYIEYANDNNDDELVGQSLVIYMKAIRQRTFDDHHDLIIRGQIKFEEIDRQTNVKLDRGMRSFNEHREYLRFETLPHRSKLKSSTKFQEIARVEMVKNKIYRFRFSELGLFTRLEYIYQWVDLVSIGESIPVFFAEVVAPYTQPYTQLPQVKQYTLIALIALFAVYFLLGWKVKRFTVTGCLLFLVGLTALLVSYPNMQDHMSIEHFRVFELGSINLVNAFLVTTSMYQILKPAFLSEHYRLLSFILTAIGAGSILLVAARTSGTEWSWLWHIKEYLGGISPHLQDLENSCVDWSNYLRLYFIALCIIYRPWTIRSFLDSSMLLCSLQTSRLRKPMMGRGWVLLDFYFLVFYNVLSVMVMRLAFDMEDEDRDTKGYEPVDSEEKDQPVEAMKSKKPNI